MRSLITALVVAHSAALVIPGRAAVRCTLPRHGGVIAQEGGMSDEERDKMMAARNEQLAKQVEAMLTEFPKKLAPGTTPPAALSKLDEALKAKDYQSMFLGIYEVTIEGECMYQLNDAQLLEPLGDVDWTNTEDETVKAKMKYLYTMGLQMLSSGGPETQEKIKDIVMKQLVTRTGLEGKAFDDWLL
jgi:hypothetical protein